MTPATGFPAASSSTGSASSSVIAASSVSGSQYGRGTSSVNVPGCAAARVRTCSTRRGVAAVRYATIRTRASISIRRAGGAICPVPRVLGSGPRVLRQVNDADAVGGVDDRLVPGAPAHAIALVTDAAEELDYLAATSRLSVNPTHFDAVADARIAALLRGHESPPSRPVPCYGDRWRPSKARSGARGAVRSTSRSPASLS